MAAASHFRYGLHPYPHFSSGAGLGFGGSVHDPVCPSVVVSAEFADSQAIRFAIENPAGIEDDPGTLYGRPGSSPARNDQVVPKIQCQADVDVYDGAVADADFHGDVRAVSVPRFDHVFDPASLGGHIRPVGSMAYHPDLLHVVDFSQRDDPVGRRFDNSNADWATIAAHAFDCPRILGFPLESSNRTGVVLDGRFDFRFVGARILPNAVRQDTVAAGEAHSVARLIDH